MFPPKFISCAPLIIGLHSGAAFASDVVLYPSNDVQTVSPLAAQFEKQHPELNVSVVRAGSGALMPRIKAEPALPLGDTFWSGGLSTIGALQYQLEPYKSPEAGAVPSQYHARHDQWLGTDTHVTVLMVNTRQAPDEKSPAGWVDLADPEWKGRIVTPDPMFSSASYLALYGFEETLGDVVYSQIVRNAVIVGTPSATYQGAANGDFAVAVTMEHAAYQYVAGGMQDIKLVYSAQGTFLPPDGMALINGAKHPAEARKLYDLPASQEVRRNILKTAYRRPLRTDIDVSKLSELPALQNVKVIPLDDRRMEEDRTAFLAQWCQLVSSN